MASNIIALLLVIALVFLGSAEAKNYCGEALRKSIIFFEAQRSGKLTHNRRVILRGDSGLGDGSANGVGDGFSDHKCWQRPEDMTTSRKAYKIDTNNPGSDLAGEKAAAMASASIVFKDSNPAYSCELLSHSEQFLMQSRDGKNEAILQQYQQKAEFFMCSCLGKNEYNIQRTLGGLLHIQKWNKLHFVIGSSYLLTVYSDYLSSAGKKLQCPNGNVDPSELLALAKSQVQLTIYLVITQEPQATWWDMDQTIPVKFTTGTLPKPRTGSTPPTGKQKPKYKHLPVPKQGSLQPTVPQ
ncbi:hypothetical protein KI387_013996, partial [Taxus chinensis]